MWISISYGLYQLLVLLLDPVLSDLLQSCPSANFVSDLFLLSCFKISIWMQHFLWWVLKYRITFCWHSAHFSNASFQTIPTSSIYSYLLYFESVYSKLYYCDPWQPQFFSLLFFQLNSIYFLSLSNNCSSLAEGFQHELGLNILIN